MCPAWDGGARVGIKEVNTVSALEALSPEGKEDYIQGYLGKRLCTGGKSLIMEAHGAAPARKANERTETSTRGWRSPPTNRSYAGTLEESHDQALSFISPMTLGTLFVL